MLINREAAVVWPFTQQIFPVLLLCTQVACFYYISVASTNANRSFWKAEFRAGLNRVAIYTGYIYPVPPLPSLLHSTDLVSEW